MWGAQADANVPAERRKQKAFIKALASPILRRGVRDATNTKEALVKLTPILEPFVDESVELQTEILFEAQRICHEGGHKPGALQ